MQAFADCLNCCSEPSEIFADPVFTDSDWRKHTISSFRRHLKPQPKILLGVIKLLSPILIWVIAVSTVVCLYAHFLQEGLGWPVACSSNYLEPFIIVSFAISLLLVFRTQSSYARWWEARIIYGKVYHVCRDIARLVLCYIPEKELDIALEMVKWDAAFTAVSCAFINQDDSFYKDAGDMLTDSEITWLQSCQQPPIALLHQMSRLLSRASVGSIQRVAIEKRITELDLCVGGAERISKQPIPLAYTRHTSRILITFLTFLPFALWEGLQWLTIPVMAVLTFLLVGIENIGIQIEQPFMTLPLHAFSSGTRMAVEEVLLQHKMGEQGGVMCPVGVVVMDDDDVNSPLSAAAAAGKKA